MGYSLASTGNRLLLVKFSGASKYKRGKVDFGWVETLVLFFAICGPKLTRLGTCVQKGS